MERFLSVNGDRPRWFKRQQYAELLNLHNADYNGAACVLIESSGNEPPE
jgi:hypothetical protein